MKSIKTVITETRKKQTNSPFSPLTAKGLIEILDLTIKKDNNNKVVTFIGCLLAYTEDSQINISFNGPSSTGKSYIALEVAKLFPTKDVIKLGNCSKTAFFHEQSTYNKEKNEFVVDLSRRILIFTDMPHTGLLESLRSFLSHDEKIMYSKITDKNTKGGLKTKNVALVGFPRDFLYGRIKNGSPGNDEVHSLESGGRPGETSSRCTQHNYQGSR